MRKTTRISSLLPFLMGLLLCSLTWSQESSADQDTLRSINERITNAYLSDDYNAQAKGHYERAMYNFRVHLRDRDVIDDLIKSAKICRLIRDEECFYSARMTLAAFYIEEEIFLQEAIKLTAEAFQYYSENDDAYNKAVAVTQLGRAHQQRTDYDKAITYVEEGLKASLDMGDKDMELQNRIIITKLLSNLGKVERVLEQGRYIISVEEFTETKKYSPEAHYIIGKTLTQDGRETEAIPYLKKAVELNPDINDLAYESNDLLSKLYTGQDSIRKAFTHLLRANQITNELYNQEKYATTSKVAVEYQTYEKNKEIRQLEEQNELSSFKLTQRTRFFLILSFILAISAFAAFNYYRLQKHRYDSEKLLSAQKSEIDRQKINELENSLKIKNLEAVVRGQEAERTRIATDLHDSLGGMLSTLKLQYDALQVDHENLSLDKDYHKIMSLIDEACGDVRDIARNLKPNALEKLGLSSALRDLVNRYRIKGTLDITLSADGIDGLINSENQLHVYRIIQELLNNALKHAQATDIDVIVNRNDTELVIMVQDNGNGFDHQVVTRGLGLGNLESRVNVLRGEMEIDSSLARGTSVTVHIPLDKVSEPIAT